MPPIVRSDGSIPTRSEKGRATAIFNSCAGATPDIRTALSLREPLAAAGGHRSLRPDDRRKREQDRPGPVRPVPDPHALAEADPEEVERLVYSTGFYRQKTESIIALSVDLVERHGGEVPASLDELVPLRGVGRKTASVVLAEAFGQPAIAVDTHVRRVSNRLGLTNGQDPLKIEQDLKAVFPRSTWSKLSMSVIQFGRDVCTARSPRCPECELARLCPWPYKTGPDTAGPDTAGPHRRPRHRRPRHRRPRHRRPRHPAQTPRPSTPPDTPGQNAGMTTDGAAKGDDRPANPAAAVPALGTLAIDPLVSLTDTVFVAQLGEVPLAALGVDTAVFSFAFFLFNFLAYGTTPLLAGAIGRGIRSAPGRIAWQAVVLAITAGVVAMVLLQVFAEPILGLMGAEGEVTDPALVYLRIRALAAPAVVLIIAANGVFRGLQDTRTPLVVTVAISLLNLVLDPLVDLRRRLGRRRSRHRHCGGAVAGGGVVSHPAGPEPSPRRHPMVGPPSRPGRSPAEGGATSGLRTFALVGFFTLATAQAARVSTAAVAAHQVASQLWLLLALVVDALAIAAQAMVGLASGG